MENTNITPPAPGPQCPPVPLDDLIKARRSFEEDVEDGYRTGFSHGLAAAQRLAAEERQRGADEELEAVCAYIASDGAWFANSEHRLRELRAARRPPAPTLREQAMAALRGSSQHGAYRCIVPEAYDLLCQALEEAGDG